MHLRIAAAKWSKLEYSSRVEWYTSSDVEFYRFEIMPNEFVSVNYQERLQFEKDKHISTVEGLAGRVQGPRIICFLIRSRLQSGERCSRGQRE